MGSSSSRSFGREASVIATSSCRRSPCASEATTTSALGARPTSASASRARSASVALGGQRAAEAEAVSRVRLHREHDVGEHAELGKHRRDLVGAAEARATRGDRPARVAISRPSKRMLPASGAISPASWLTSVVLPAPLGPMTACTSPGTTVEVDAIGGGEAAEPLHEAGDLEEAHAASGDRAGAPRRRASRSTM